MTQNDFSNLNFDRPTRTIPRRAMWVGAALAPFTLAWLVIPQAMLYWLALPVIGLLAWAASYGWRQALAVLVDFIHRLEDL